MDTIKKRMIEKAKSIYGSISFCGRKTSWDECFTLNGNVLMFWFNIGRDTRAITEEVRHDYANVL